MSGVVEGLTRAVPLGSPALQRVAGDPALPDLCKKPIHRRESELRHQACADLTPLAELLSFGPESTDTVPVRTRVFLSAVSTQFQDCRDALASDLRAVGFDVAVQEDFQQGGGSLLAKLEDYIAGCDRVIALVADAYGWEPEEEARPSGSPRRSYTQWEYFLAQGERLDGSRQASKDTFVYFATPEFLAEHPLVQSADADQLQHEFIAAIRRSGKDRKSFGSLHELRALVLRDGFHLQERSVAR